jgi:hypothetical protein
MKNRMLAVVLPLLLFGLTVDAQAQSDYETVQNFRQKHHQIEEDIKNSESLDELEGIYERINSLKSEYVSHSELLNKSLYPDNFNRSFEKLLSAYDIRKKDFAQINVLQIEVTELKGQLELLNEQNDDLLKKAQLLEKQSKNDKSQLAKLEKTLSELRLSLQKRDEMIFSMIDSLLPQSNRHKHLNPQEKQEVYSKMEKENILSSIKNSLQDNIRFIEITKLYRGDVDKIKEQQEDFTRLWQSVGPQMVEIYSDKKQGINYLKEIDETFTDWTNVLNQEIWGSIHSEFSRHNIMLRKFSSGANFTQAVNSFIDDEIKNAEVKSNDASVLAFKNFADSVWYGNIKPEWVSSLIDYKMLTQTQADSIEGKISEWKAKVAPGKINFLYIVIVVFIVAILLILFFRKSSKSELQPESDRA